MSLCLEVLMLALKSCLGLAINLYADDKTGESTHFESTNLLNAGFLAQQKLQILANPIK